MTTQSEITDKKGNEKHQRSNSKADSRSKLQIKSNVALVVSMVKKVCRWVIARSSTVETKLQNR